MFLDRSLERGDQGLEIVDVEIEIAADALGMLGRVEGVGEDLAGHVEHGLAEHLQQPAVGVPGEPLVSADLGQTLDAGVVQSDVQHRLHHSRHRELGPRPHADQQWIMPVAKLSARVILQMPQRHRHLYPELARFATQRQVLPARIGGDGEAGWHGQPQLGHLGEVRALAAEQVFLILVTFGEIEDVARHS